MGSFNKTNRWVFCTKNLRDRFGGVNTTESFLGVDKTPPALERSFKAGTKLKSKLPTDIEMESIPLEELSSLVEDDHVKTREASQDADVDMWEFLGIDKPYKENKVNS